MLPLEKRITTKNQLKEWIDCENQFYKDSLLFRFFELSEQGILHKFLILLRKAEYYYNTKHKVRYRFYYARLFLMRMRYGLNIPLNVCEKGLHLSHVGSILINGDATVGEFCLFNINTALVATSGLPYAPKIGKGVKLGIGAVCVGNITIADGVVIGANAVVTKNVLEKNITVAGVPAKKIASHS